MPKKTQMREQEPLEDETDNEEEYTDDEITLSVAPFYSTALGGIKLKVHQNDFEAVQEILDNLNNKLNIV